MKEYKIGFIDDAPLEQVDFSKAWRGVLVDNNGGGQAAYKTEFRLLKSEKYIYFYFDCEDDNAKCTLNGYNQPLYDEEVCELFFSPQGGNRYFEFEINALNANFCAMIDHGNDGNVINFCDVNPAETIVLRDKANWRAVGRIALNAIGDGEAWHFNAYRIKRDENNDMILSAFSNTDEPNFHMPERFGKLVPLL